MTTNVDPVVRALGTTKLRELYGANAEHSIVWLQKMRPYSKDGRRQEQLPTVTQARACMEILGHKEFTRLFSGWQDQRSVDKVITKALPSLDM